MKTMIVVIGVFFIFSVSALCTDPTWYRVPVQQSYDILRAVQVVTADFQGVCHSYEPDGTPDVVYSVKQNGFIRIASNYNSSNDTWSYEYVDASVPEAEGLATGDIDGDGDPDIIGTSFVDFTDDDDDDNDGFIAWWKRTYNEWDRTIIAQGELTDGHGYELPVNSAVADIDQDGDMDVVVTFLGNWEDPDESTSGLYWFENTDEYGDGSTWTAHVIDTEINRPYAVCVAYLNVDEGDPIPDIALTTTDLPLGTSTAIYESVNEGVYVYYGLGDGDFSDRDTLYHYDPESEDPFWVSPRSVKAADFDENGYFDLVVAFTNKQNPTQYQNHHGVAIFKGSDDGNGGVTWDQNPITPAYMTPRDVYPIDFDGDDDMDFFVSSLWGNEVSWFENLGTGWDQHYVGACLLAKGISMEDFVSGGRQEVVAASYDSDWNTPPTLSGRTIQMYKYAEAPPPMVLTETFSLTLPSTVELNGTLSYSYSFTLEDTSAIQLYAKYDVYIPDQRFVSQTTLDTLGYLPDTYTGEGSISIPDSIFTTGTQCKLYITVGRIVTSETNPPVEMYHGEKVICDTFTVVNPEYNAEVSEIQTELPVAFGIKSVQPNPFNPTVVCTITIPQSADLIIEVFNITGQRVATIWHGSATPGSHSYLFDGTDVASGVYFLRAVVPGHMNEIRKLVLLR